MESLVYLDNLINVVRGIITVCAGLRVGMVMFNTISDPDENKPNTKRIKNTLIFWVCAMGATVIMDIIRSYF